MVPHALGWQVPLLEHAVAMQQTVLQSSLQWCTRVRHGQSRCGVYDMRNKPEGGGGQEQDRVAILGIARRARRGGGRSQVLPTATTMSNLPRQLGSFLQRAAKPTVARVPHRAVLSVTGIHAVQFLNGLISSTIPAEPANIYTSFLHAQASPN